MPIRRLVLLLTVTLFGGGAADQWPRPAVDDPTESDAFTAPALFAAGPAPVDAVIRSSGRLFSAGWQTGSGTGPWPRPDDGETGRRAESTDIPTMWLVAAVSITTVVARAVETTRREVSRQISRACCGFVSSPHTAPPPFRFV